jgi:acyl carrier protein
MSAGSGQYVRSLILARFEEPIIAFGLDPAKLDDDFDLLTEGVIDSLGVVELISAIEQQLGLSLDLSELDPENLTVLGPLSRYIEEQCSQSVPSRRFA